MLCLHTENQGTQGNKQTDSQIDQFMHLLDRKPVMTERFESRDVILAKVSEADLMLTRMIIPMINGMMINLLLRRTDF